MAAPMSGKISIEVFTKTGPNLHIESTDFDESKSDFSNLLCSIAEAQKKVNATLTHLLNSEKGEQVDGKGDKTSTENGEDNADDDDDDDDDDDETAEPDLKKQKTQ